MNYAKILIALSGKDFFDVDFETQRKFINKLGPANNDIDRSYKQYLCQRLMLPWHRRVMWFFVSLLGLLLHIPFIYVKSFISCKCLIRKVDAICSFKHMQEVIPEAFINKYSMDFDAWDTGVELSTSDLKFIIQILFQTKSLYLTYKSAVLISKYSYMITHYHPRAIAVFGEFSCASSIRTAYCESRGTLHVNVMHGERMLIISDSYFRFHECYIWLEYYKQLFIEMFADEKQFIIALPYSLTFNPADYYNDTNYSDYRYYLQGDSEGELKEIGKTVEEIQLKGYSIKCRLHPRYSHLERVSKYIDATIIEQPSDISILESISSTGTIIAQDSTVLLQASCVGIEVIMDDVTNKSRYEFLCKAKYVMIHRPHLLLSEYLPNLKNKSN